QRAVGVLARGEHWPAQPAFDLGHRALAWQAGLRLRPLLPLEENETVRGFRLRGRTESCPGHGDRNSEYSARAHAHRRCRAYQSGARTRLYFVRRRTGRVAASRLNRERPRDHVRRLPRLACVAIETLCDRVASEIFDGWIDAKLVVAW